MEKLLTGKIHIGVEEPHTLCGGAIDSLTDTLESELEMGLQAIAERIREKFGKYQDGGEGKIIVTVEV